MCECVCVLCSLKVLEGPGCPGTSWGREGEAGSSPVRPVWLRPALPLATCPWGLPPVCPFLDPDFCGSPSERIVLKGFRLGSSDRILLLSP